MSKIGRRYRDLVKGVVGTAIAQAEDETEIMSGGMTAVAHTALTQLKLDSIHIEGHPDVDQESPECRAAPKAHDKRWYEDERLEEIDA